MSENGPNKACHVSSRLILAYLPLMDFEHIFDQLEITTKPFAICELHGNCDLDMGHDVGASIHYVLTGEGALIFPDAPPIQVAPGSLVLIPALQSHILRCFGVSSDSVLKCEAAELKLDHLLKNNQRVNENRQMSVLCSHIQVGLRGAIDVIDLIRAPIVERIGTQSVLHPTLHTILRELSNPTLGSRAMIRALLTQCVIETLRTRLIHDDGGLRWMAALRDPSVWEAILTMLNKPGEPHTVESLAQKVGMSRSTFAEKFTAAYGSGPIELLRDLRIRRASKLLSETELPVKRIAQLVGFNSRTAFSRVFEQRTGQSPSAYRRDV